MSVSAHQCQSFIKTRVESDQQELRYPAVSQTGTHDSQKTGVENLLDC